MKAFIFVNDNGVAYRRYKNGELPAQFVYGVSELENMGCTIKVGTGNFLIDLFRFVIFRPDLFFMPFIKRKTLFFYFLGKMTFTNTKFLGWLHGDIFYKPKSKIKQKIYMMFKFVLSRYIRALDKIFFLSQKTMDELILKEGLSPQKCVTIPWGGDIDFYSSYYSSISSNYFISTGRENRDIYKILNAISNTNATLKIYTNDMSLPDSFVNAIGDTKINKGIWTYSYLLQETSKALCILVPLKRDKINYCVGLSSLVEAFCLGRPVIVTENPYWYIDIEEENVGIVIDDDSVESWVNAIDYLSSNPDIAHEMGENARRLFLNRFNFSKTEELIRENIQKLFI